MSQLLIHSMLSVHFNFRFLSHPLCSFDEHALIDLPTMLDKVMDVTQQKDMFYAGHSQVLTSPSLSLSHHLSSLTSIPTSFSSFFLPPTSLPHSFSLSLPSSPPSPPPLREQSWDLLGSLLIKLLPNTSRLSLL